MKKAFVSHLQLVIFSFLSPLVLLLIELILIFILPIKKDMFLFAVITVQFVGAWAVCFAFYHDSYRIVRVSEEAITSGKHKILWENVEKFQIEEVKLFQFSIIPTIYLSSMVFIFGNDGEKIGFSMTRKNIEVLAHYKDKNIIINNFANNYNL